MIRSELAYYNLFVVMEVPGTAAIKLKGRRHEWGINIRRDQFSKAYILKTTAAFLMKFVLIIDHYQLFLPMKFHGHSNNRQ